MNKAEVYDLLRTRGIWHEITEHKAVYNMAELTDVALPYPEADAKNLFVRDDKKRNYYLITVRGDKRVDLKEFRHKYGTRALSFASENDLMQVLGLIPGAVTPSACSTTPSARCSSISTPRFSPRRGSSACTRTTTRPPCGCARTISQP